MVHFNNTAGMKVNKIESSSFWRGLRVSQKLFTGTLKGHTSLWITSIDLQLYLLITWRETLLYIQYLLSAYKLLSDFKIVKFS